MPYISNDIDIDVDDFLGECSECEINEIIDALIEDGYIQKNQVVVGTSMGSDESVFEDALTKLHGRWNMLSRDEEELILNIAKRLP